MASASATFTETEAASEELVAAPFALLSALPVAPAVGLQNALSLIDLRLLAVLVGLLLLNVLVLVLVLIITITGCGPPLS